MISVKDKGDWTFEITMSDEEAAIIDDVLEREHLTMDELLTAFVKWTIEDPERFRRWYNENEYLLDEGHL